jgi:uncharacterized protein (DUF305 family)
VALRLVTLALEENENLRIREIAQKNIVSVHEQREIAQMCRWPKDCYPQG